MRPGAPAAPGGCRVIELHDRLLIRSGNARALLQRIAQLDLDFIVKGEDV
jgi:hypothetical protein